MQPGTNGAGIFAYGAASGARRRIFPPPQAYGLHFIASSRNDILELAGQSWADSGLPHLRMRAWVQRRVVMSQVAKGHCCSRKQAQAGPYSTRAPAQSAVGADG